MKKNTDYDTTETTLEKRNYQSHYDLKNASRDAVETISEQRDDNPKGGLKTRKKWGGVLYV